MDGIKKVTLGGIGAFKVGGKKTKAKEVTKATPKNKVPSYFEKQNATKAKAPVKAKKVPASKNKPSEKKKVNLFIKTPWSK